MIKSSPVLIFRIVLGLLILALTISLFRLQVIKGEYYKQAAELNFVRIRRVPATRGEIYDSKYRPIAVNIPSHNLYLTSGKIHNLEALVSFLTANFQITEEELNQLVFAQRFKTYEEILLAVNLEYEKVLMLSEQMNRFPELSFRIGTTRSYLYPNHFTGYVGRINQEEYTRYKEEDYSINSYIGKTGLESYYEVLLRGRDGREIVQVDAQGRSLDLFRNEGSIEPLNGLSLILTIDNDLQAAAEQAFPAGRKGAVVVLDAKTGGVLAYVSRPVYDPNLFMQRISPEIWEQLNTPDKPMLDRVIHAAYPPGSVYKPLTAEIGLELGLANRNTMFSPCVGGMKIGNRFFKCWSSGGHGRTNVIDALKHSCDVYFYDLSLRIKLDDFARYAALNHLCTPTGIDLPNERRGFFPTLDWYQKKLGRNINVQGHKVNLSIGQGEVLTTPMQIAAFYNAIANNGFWTQPHLLRQSVGRGRLTREQVQKVQRTRLPITPSNMALIQEGLWAVVNAPGGTGAGAKIQSATIYGKTGSAENSMGRMTHAWFAGYLVTDRPEIVVCVFAENAGGGGAICAPVARTLFNYYQGNREMIRQQVPVPMNLGEAQDTEEETPPAEPSPETTPIPTQEPESD